MVIEELVTTRIKSTLSIHAHVLFLTLWREGKDWIDCFSDAKTDDQRTEFEAPGCH